VPQATIKAIEEKNMKNLMKFIRDEEGLTTVEYAIAGGLVGAGVIAAFRLLGVEVARVITAITGALSAIVIAP
jgi:pilus assembly protein Flp/PilA